MADPPASLPHRVEPELAQPVPRPVEASTATWVARVLLGGVVVAAAAVGWSTADVALRVVCAVFGAMAAVGWLVLEVCAARSAALLRDGAVVVGVVEESTDSRVLNALGTLASLTGRGSTADFAKITLAFRTAQGLPVRRALRLSRSAAPKAFPQGFPAGTSMTIVHDPDRPRRHAIYRLVRSVRVAAPSA